MARTYGNNASRGYGTPHQKLRAKWKPLVESGQVQCHAELCLEERDGGNRWIPPGAPWHLGHTPDRSGWTGPEHQRCGCADGARRGNQDRPRTIAAALGPGRSPVCKVCGKEYHYAAKQCGICGRHYHPSRKVQYTCSRPCGVAFKRLGMAPVQIPSCEVCGKPCSKPKQRTCSPSCAHKLQWGERKELTCEQCARKFEGYKARHCSSNCAALAHYYANRKEEIDKRLASYYAKQGRQQPVRVGPPRRNGRAFKRMTATPTGTVPASQSRLW